MKIRITARAQEFRRRPTRSERLLWNALKERQLDGLKFRRQQPIGWFIVDFYNSAERLVVEVDGGVHDSTAERDEARQRALETLGLRVVRVSASQVERDIGGVLTAIRATLPPRADIPPSPLVGEGLGVGGTSAAPPRAVRRRRREHAR